MEHINKIIKNGHFKLSSGRHSDKYINKDELFFNLPTMYTVLKKTKDVAFSFNRTQLITGPAMAGAILAAHVAYSLRIPYVYPDKVDNDMVFRKCFHEPIKGKNVLIVEDIITTGSSVIKTARAIEDLGGFVLGVVCICNRGNWNPYNLIVRSLIDIEMNSWDANDCPLCEHSDAVDPKIDI